MAISFATDNPIKLLNDFDARIAQREEKGKITTWEKDAAGDYTHKSPQWRGQAWFRPVKQAGRLMFHIIRPQDKSITTPVYGYYHGHLIETFLNHFDKQFSSSSATSQCVPGDLCSVA